MEKNWGITIPKLESDITDRLKNPSFNIYIPPNISFTGAKKLFKKEFLKRELELHLGNVSELAKRLGLDRRSIHRAIKQFRLDMDSIRSEQNAEEKYKESLVNQTIRSSLDQYKELIIPQKLEQMYQDVPHLSRNIAKVLTWPDLTWKEAEREFERQFLAQALKESKNSISKTAEKIRIRVETLHRKAKKLGLK